MGPSGILLDVLLSGSTTYWPREQTSPLKVAEKLEVSLGEREPTEVADEPDVSHSERDLMIESYTSINAPEDSGDSPTPFAMSREHDRCSNAWIACM